jgi:hypothetical protein
MVASCAAENVGGVHADADDAEPAVDDDVEDDADDPDDDDEGVDPADEPVAPELDELADADSFVTVIVY